MRHQLIVRTFIDRRMQLFARLTDNQIVQYYVGPSIDDWSAR
jgi:hypothetical protein